MLIQQRKYNDNTVWPYLALVQNNTTLQIMKNNNLGADGYGNGTKAQKLAQEKKRSVERPACDTAPRMIGVSCWQFRSQPRVEDAVERSRRNNHEFKALGSFFGAEEFSSSHEVSRADNEVEELQWLEEGSKWTEDGKWSLSHGREKNQLVIAFNTVRRYVCNTFLTQNWQWAVSFSRQWVKRSKWVSERNKNDSSIVNLIISQGSASSGGRYSSVAVLKQKRRRFSWRYWVHYLCGCNRALCFLAFRAETKWQPWEHQRHRVKEEDLPYYVGAPQVCFFSSNEATTEKNTNGKVFFHDMLFVLSYNENFKRTSSAVAAGSSLIFAVDASNLLADRGPITQSP